MILVIDAYNVLKYSNGDSTITQHQRARFINDLNGYAQGRKIKPLVIFDGGPDRWALHELYGSVEVIYPGSGISADDYIIDYIHHNASKDLLLVSSDRALSFVAHQQEVPSIDAPLFWSLMQRALKTSQTRKKVVPIPTIKLTHEKNPDLDTLMMTTEATHIGTHDEELLMIIQQSGKRLSKNDRKLLTKLKKLL